MMRANFLPVLVASVACVAGCGGGVSLGSVPNGLGADGNGADGSPGGSGAYDITCTAYFQPATNGGEESFTVRSDASAQKTIAFPGNTVNVSYANATLAISVPELGVSQSYPLVKDRRPAADFFGDHGFTGLVYLGPDVQYICKASGTPTPPSGNRPPIDIGCNVELRTTPGGPVEQSATIDLKGEDSQQRKLGDLGVSAVVNDSPYEGRALYISIWKAPNGEHAYSSRQLYQFDRMTNHFADGSFTGRIALGLGSDRELSYTCSSR